MHNRCLTQTACMLALTLLLQSLRMFIPIPPFATTFLIGSLVNACLLVSATLLGFWPTVLIASIAPITAFFQQMLPLPVLIFPIAAGNVIYICLYLLIVNKYWLNTVIAALGKAGFIYSACIWLFTWINIPAQTSSALLFVMGWPQLITGILGGILAVMVCKRLNGLRGGVL